MAPAPGPSERDNWHQRLGYPNERFMQAARNIAETVLKFTDSLIACDIYNINNGTKHSICFDPSKTEITQRLLLVSADLLGPLIPAARRNYRFMAKCFNHYTVFKVVPFISTKDTALITEVKFVQDFVMPLRLRLLHLGKFTADYYHAFCKAPATIQQFNSPNTPVNNSLSEWDGRTIMNVARCETNRAALPKFLWGGMATPVVFLLNRPPSKTIGGDTSVRQDVQQIRRSVLSADYWDPSTWRPPNASCANFGAHPISSSLAVATVTSSSLASVALYTAPATRRRRGLHQ